VKTSSNALLRKSDDKLYLKLKKTNDITGSSNSSKSSLEQRYSQSITNSITNSDSNNKATLSGFLSSTQSIQQLSLQQLSIDNINNNINNINNILTGGSTGNTNQKIVDILQSFQVLLQQSNSICNLLVPDKNNIFSQAIITNKNNNNDSNTINNNNNTIINNNINSNDKDVNSILKVIDNSQKLNKETEKLCNEVIQAKRNQKSICINDILNKNIRDTISNSNNSNSASNNNSNSYNSNNCYFDNLIALESEQRLKKYETFFNISSQNIKEVVDLMKFVSRKEEEELLVKDNKINLLNEKVSKIESHIKTTITSVTPANIKNNNKNLIIQKKNTLIPVQSTSIPSISPKLCNIPKDKELDIDDDYADCNENDLMDRMDKIDLCENAKIITLPISKIKSVNKNIIKIPTNSKNLRQSKIPEQQNIPNNHIQSNMHTIQTEPDENIPNLKFHNAFEFD